MTTEPEDNSTRRKHAAELLASNFTPEGTRIFAMCKHFTTTGTRYYDFYVVTDYSSVHAYLDRVTTLQNMRITRITNMVAAVTGARYDKRRECIRTDNDSPAIVRALGLHMFNNAEAFTHERLD